MKISSNKPVIVRVVTAPEAVEFHLKNTLEFISNDFTTLVVGDGVSKFRGLFPAITYVDLKIERKISLWADLVAIVKLVIILRSLKPCVIHTIMPKAGLIGAVAGSIARVPVRVHTFTGQVWANKVGISKRILILIDRLIVTLNTDAFTDSFSQSDFLFKSGVSKYGLPLPVIGDGSLSGVDLNRFDPSKLKMAGHSIRKKYGVPEQAFVFLFVGRKCRDKGVLDLIEAFASVQKRVKLQSYLMLVGPDEDHGEITARLEERRDLSQNVISVGIVSRPEEYFAAANVFCLPSYREGFGSVVIEAAALKLPTIGTRISGLVDAIVDGETGMLVSPGNINELAEAMVKLATSPSLAECYGVNARRRVEEKFSSLRLYTRLKDFYLEKCNLIPEKK